MVRLVDIVTSPSYADSPLATETLNGMETRKEHHCFNRLRSGQDGRNFAGDIFKLILPIKIFVF